MSTPPPPSTTNPPHPSSSSPSSSFPFPRDYSFPPFFTRQTNLTTHHAQLTKWSTLVLAYCRHHRIFKLFLSGNGTSTGTGGAGGGAGGPGGGEVDTTELFYNRRIDRRLALSDIREVIDFLRRDGRAEYVGENNAAEGGDVVWIYWHTPEEWASLVEDWVDTTGQKGSVLTVYELVEGDGTGGSEFHGLDQELLLKALNVLVKRGKAQVFGQEDSLGVKFF